MTMLKFPALFFFIMLVSCGPQNSARNNGKAITAEHKEPGNKGPGPFYLDTSMIAILAPDSSHQWLFKDAQPIDITNEELRTVDQGLKICLQAYNARQDTSKEFSAFISLEKYKRQYVPFADANGHRKVYVNCFCTSDWAFENWKKYLVMVDDGGNCYFQLLIDLTEKTYDQFSVNGYG